MVSSVLSDGRMGMDLSNAHEDRFELVVGGDPSARLVMDSGAELLKTFLANRYGGVGA
jgi:hypothetical protein